MRPRELPRLREGGLVCGDREESLACNAKVTPLYLDLPLVSVPTLSLDLSLRGLEHMLEPEVLAPDDRHRKRRRKA